MLDQSIFNELTKVKGYMGAVLSGYTGEVLVSDTSKVKKLDETSMTINEDFRNLHEVSEALGLGHMQSMDIKAGNATVIMVCGGTESRVHLHALVIMNKEGSVALAKIALDKMIEKALVELEK